MLSIVENTDCATCSRTHSSREKHRQAPHLLLETVEHAVIDLHALERIIQPHGCFRGALETALPAVP